MSQDYRHASLPSRLTPHIFFSAGDQDTSMLYVNRDRRDAPRVTHPNPRDGCFTMDQTTDIISRCWGGGGGGYDRSINGSRLTGGRGSLEEFRWIPRYLG